jgi:hypothetical protein
MGSRGRAEFAVATPLFRRVLGAAYERLPAAVRAMHDITGDCAAEGRAEITRGTSPLARLVAALIGFPRAGDDVPVRVSFDVRDGREIWRRDFGGRRFASTQLQGTGPFEGSLCERFGPLTVGLALAVEKEGLALAVQRVSLFGIPLPGRWMPYSKAFESAQGGRFNFDVEIGHPWTGTIVRYRGWLVPVTKPE